MWIVRLALRRPYTFVVAALLIAILGGAAIATLPVDIFPYIDIPVVSVVWQYNGLTPEEMESRIVTNFERALTSNVVGIEHIESQSHQSIAVVRVYFHASVQVDLDAREKVHADDGDALMGLRFDVLDADDVRRERALEVRDDAAFHLLGREAVVLPHHAHDRDI